MGNSIQATNKLQQLVRLWKADFWKFSSQSNNNDIEVRILEELCKVGADLNCLEIKRGFALIPNVFWSEELMRFFVNKGMDVNSGDEKGDTALHLAIHHSEYDSEHDNYKEDLVEFILKDLNADPNVTNLRGETPLFTHANRVETILKYSPQSWYDHQEECSYQLGIIGKVTEMLVDRGADVTIRNCDGESVLHKCVHDINSRIIQKFKVGEVDFRTSNWLYSKTPLMVAAACKENRMENCRLLLDRGADVNARDLQGCTALHHAVLNGAYDKCAEFLIQEGADPNVISVSGKDVYDMNRFNSSSNVFTHGASPAKQLQILEIMGAKQIVIIGKNIIENPKDTMKLWNQAIDFSKAFDLQPSQQFLTSYHFTRENLQNPNRFEEIWLSAMNTIESLSKGSSAKFWNLLDVSNYWYDNVFNILNFLSEELKNVEDFASFEEIDFKSLSDLVEFFSRCLRRIESGEDSKNESLTPERICHVHSITRLTIACFNKLTHETNSNKVSDTYMELSFKLCYVLTSLHVRFHDVISEEAFNENKRLLKELMDLDLRDKHSNRLIQRIFGNNCSFMNKYLFKKDLIGSLLEDF